MIISDQSLYAEMLMRPVSHAAATCTHLALAQEAIKALLEACCNKQPAFGIDKLNAICKQAYNKESGTGDFATSFIKHIHALD